MSLAQDLQDKNRLKESPFSRYFSSKPILLTSASILLVLAGYVWFISFGLWTPWHTTTDYYDQLASAFAHGSLALEKPVAPALLLLENPYNPNERGGIDYPLDFSLYQGRYYLYFGPLPALLLAIFKGLGFGTIGDQYLVFGFVSGILIFQSLLFLEIRKQFFPTIPDWILPICIVFGGLISPFTWILTEARVYEAASAAGQFFFLAGLYFNLRALNRESPLPGRFLIGGILWAFCLGSRLTQVLPVGFFSLVLTLLSMRTYFKTKSASNALQPILSLALPLALGIALLGWYNWARFGSILETGYSYQLSTPYLQKYSPKLFLPVYILPNLYDYLAAPPRVIDSFPFLQPVRGRGNLLFPFLVLPKVYYTRAMTGILFSTPFILLAGISLLPMLFPKYAPRGPGIAGQDTHLFRWTVFGLWGSFLFGLVPIVSFFWVVTRYFTDFSPSLVILSMVGFWQGYSLLSTRPISRTIYVLGGILLMLASVVISTLLVLSIRSPNFQAWNPGLWDQLTVLFSK